MRYRPDHKKEVRQRILRAAGRRFRVHGIAQTSVASVMQEAGLTHGGFYNHFQDKNDLVEHVINSAFDRASERFESRFDGLEGDTWIEAWVRAYLSDGHRDARDLGCPFTSVTAEVSGADTRPEALRAFGRMYHDRIEALMRRVDAPRPEARRRVMAATAQMIGALMLSRSLDATSSADLRRAVGDEAIKTLRGATA